MAMTPESLARDTDQLFSLPDVALRINELIDKPTTRPADLAEVVLCDSSLSARLLRLVNSAFYARTTPIQTISQAIKLVGQRALRELVIATCAVDMFKGLPKEHVSMERFWLNGAACGITARHIAEHCKLRDRERVFLVGLLHGVGRLIFFSQCPDTYLEVLRLVEQDALDTIAAEERVFGFNYAQLGAELLKAWRLPESTWKAVAYHLEPESAPEYRLESEILHAATLIANLMQTTAVPDKTSTTIELSADLAASAARLQIPEDTLASLPLQVDLEIFEMYEILIPGSSVIY